MPTTSHRFKKDMFAITTICSKQARSQRGARGVGGEGGGGGEEGGGGGWGVGGVSPPLLENNSPLKICVDIFWPS